MDLPTLIREIKALPVADKHLVLDALCDDLGKTGSRSRCPSTTAN